MTIQLRGNARTEDPRLDRVIEFDQRSRSFPIRAVAPPEQRLPRSYTWRVGVNLDQGREGACVGFAWSHEAASKPAVIPGVTDATALALYRIAQTLDPWPGEDYEGTSVLAGAKAARARGYYGEFRWAFSVVELAAAIPRGPAVAGTWWWSGMWDADANGFLRPRGSRVGGHAWLVNGVTIVRRDPKAARSWDNVDPDRSYFTMHNSWGADWGRNGQARITWADMESLLLDDGEACFPSIRLRPKTA